MDNLIDYLASRGISESVARKYGLYVNGYDEIVIPVHFAEPGGKVVFNKYRKSPDNTDKEVPKYRYDKGSYVRLYNEHAIHGAQGVLITEGELDTLAVLSVMEGWSTPEMFTAVSSTGGSQSFRREWAHQFADKDVYVVYDRDEAGIKGAIRLQQMIPHAKIIWLPEIEGVKDISDFLKAKRLSSNDELIGLMARAQSYNIPMPLEYNLYPTTKAGLLAKKKEYDALMSVYKQMKSDLTARNRERYWVDAIIEELRRQVEPVSKRITALGARRRGYVEADNATREATLEKAKSVPITDIHQFNNAGFCNCPWHNEKTPSLKYYPATNTMYCFGGCGPKDVIDLMQKLHDISFKEAVERLCNM